MAGYDILGNIVLMKFPLEMKKSGKLRIAKKFLNEHKNVGTVLEKSGSIHGRLRTPETKYVAGVKTREALYHENGCVFRFDAQTSYFSPRLSSERAELANMVKKGEEVLVLFGGVAPFAIVIAKTKKANRVVSVELGKIPSKYALMNVKSNKVNVEVIQGDVNRVLPKMKDKFDRVIMARPNLKDSFLDVSLPKVLTGGILHYYGFYEEDKINDLKELIETEAKKSGRKIKIIRIKKAGDVGVRKYRYRVDVKMLD
jgi:tRNA (guanine37-N1)-methyltransferase